MLRHILLRLIDLYYRIDSPTLRSLARRFTCYRLRTLLLDRFLKNNPVAVPAQSLMPDSISSAGKRWDNRRMALYTFPFEEDDDVALRRFEREDPYRLDPAPFWGSSSPLDCRFLVPLPRIVAELRNTEIEGDCLGAFVGNRFVTMLISASSPFCFEVLLKHDVSSRGRTHSFRIRRKRRQIGVELGLYFASNNGYADNYFHALLEALPSLTALIGSLNIVERREAQILLPSSLPPSIRTIVETLAVRHELRILEFSDQTQIKAKRLLLSPYRSQMVDVAALNRLSKFHVNAADAQSLRIELLAGHETALNADDASDMLYVTRAGLGDQGKRQTRNAAEIADYMKRASGRVIHPETMSISDQIGAMHRAKIVVFDAGAAVANILFCAPGTSVLVLTQPAAAPNLFMSLAQALGVEIGFVYGEPLVSDSMHAAHPDIHVPLDRVEKALAFYGDKLNGKPDGWH